MKVTKVEVVRFRALVIKVFLDDGFELWFWPFNKIFGGCEGLGHVELRNSKRDQALIARYNVLESMGGGRETLILCERPATPKLFADHWKTPTTTSGSSCVTR